MIAERLVNELMLVSVLVAGDGAAAFAGQLEAAGAAAELLGEAAPTPGYDLAILLAAPESATDAAMAARVATLAGGSDRLLFAPLPLRDSPHTGGSPALPSLNDWFEVFAEHGYQPVVDFDADFVAAGAFLVDREATAAESELAAFADRLQNPLPPAPHAPAAPDDGAARAERDALRAEIAALQAQIDDAATPAIPPFNPATDESGWDALVPWVNAAVGDPSRNSEAALRHDLPRLLALLGEAAPPAALLAAAPTVPQRNWLSRLFRRGAPPYAAATPAILADITLVRASKLFDAAWYIASTPDLFAGDALDPVLHYVVIGAARGADPGPWFNTAAYVAAHPEAAAPGICALVHAIRTGEADRLMETLPD